MQRRRRAPGHYQPVIRTLGERCDAMLEPAGILQIEWAQLDAERRRHGLECAELARPRSYCRITKDCHSRQVRHNLLEQFNRFSAHRILLAGKAGDVAARPRQAIDEAGADRIGDDREHDRNGAGRLTQGPQCGAGKSHDDVRPERDQFGREFANAIGIPCGPAVIDPHVAALGPARLLQSLQERRDAGLAYRMVFGERHKHTDALDLRALLRTRRERPRDCRAAEQRDELAAFHSITSSARASTVGGTSSPSTLAVLRLIISSYFVGACTGRSAAFSPLRMRSTYSAATRN